eukprot:9185134-Pyramimonas_sp.AAC.1
MGDQFEIICHEAHIADSSFNEHFYAVISGKDYAPAGYVAVLDSDLGVALTINKHLFSLLGKYDVTTLLLKRFKDRPEVPEGD